MRVLPFLLRNNKKSVGLNQNQEYKVPHLILRRDAVRTPPIA